MLTSYAQGQYRNSNASLSPSLPRAVESAKAAGCETEVIVVDDASTDETAFLRRVKLSEEYVDRMLDSKYARHFYSAEELAGVRAQWLSNS